MPTRAGTPGRAGAGCSRIRCDRADPARLADVSRARTRPTSATFVAQVERALVERGHDVELRGARLARGRQARAISSSRARRCAPQRPDVVYAHFLVPSGLIAALGGRAPLVVTAHGRDVRNIGAIRGVARCDPESSSGAQRRSSAVSDYLRRELETKLPEARGKTEVVSSGVDLDEFTVGPAAGRAAAVRLRRRARTSARTSCVSPTRSRCSVKGR